MAKDKMDEVACNACGLDPMCSLLEYGEAGSGVPEGILLRRRPVTRGEKIYLKGDAFYSVFAIKSGSFKSAMTTAGQHEQVVGFHLAGELMGAEGMAQGIYPSTASALEPSQVCELSIDRLPEAGKSLELMQQRIIQLLGQEVAFNHELLTTLVHKRADQRVSGFLLNLSNRLKYREMPDTEFSLEMSQSDIGSFLGLANATVSRVLTRLHKSSIIVLKYRGIRILDGDALREIAQG